MSASATKRSSWLGVATLSFLLAMAALGAVLPSSVSGERDGQSPAEVEIPAPAFGS